MVHSVYNEASSIELRFSTIHFTRGNQFKLDKLQVYYDLRKYFFVNRVVDIWNSLPDDVDNANTVNTFQNRIDEFWNNQEIRFESKTELTGIRSRSF